MSEWHKRRSDVERRAGDVFEDVKNEYKEIGAIMKRFNSWRISFPKSYKVCLSKGYVALGKSIGACFPHRSQTVPT